MRRRRRNRGSWFPIFPTEIEGFDSIGFTWTDLTLTIPDEGISVGSTAVKAVPITMDLTPVIDDSAATYTLADLVQGQDWLCKRVVGNWWFNHPEGSGARVFRSVCCLALAVLPVDSIDQNNPAIPAEDYNPLFARNAQQPWLWRTTIQLSNGYWEYGPVKSTEAGLKGWNLDTKGVMRRITKEQRLFAVAAASVLDLATGPGEADTVYSWGYDLRIFGQMKPSKNRSVF